MKQTKLFILFFILLTILISCTSLEEAGKVLRNEKKSSTDEFLIKKKEPLTQPPDFDKIPEPGSEREVKTKQSDFEKMIQNTKEESNTTKTKKTSTEEFILKKIK